MAPLGWGGWDGLPELVVMMVGEEAPLPDLPQVVSS